MIDASLHAVQEDSGNNFTWISAIGANPDVIRDCQPQIVTPLKAISLNEIKDSHQ